MLGQVHLQEIEGGRPNAADVTWDGRIGERVMGNPSIASVTVGLEIPALSDGRNVVQGAGLLHRLVDDQSRKRLFGQHVQLVTNHGRVAIRAQIAQQGVKADPVRAWEVKEFVHVDDQCPPVETAKSAQQITTHLAIVVAEGNRRPEYTDPRMGSGLDHGIVAGTGVEQHDPRHTQSLVVGDEGTQVEMRILDQADDDRLFRRAAYPTRATQVAN